MALSLHFLFKVGPQSHNDDQSHGRGTDTGQTAHRGGSTSGISTLFRTRRCEWEPGSDTRSHLDGPRSRFDEGVLERGRGARPSCYWWKYKLTLFSVKGNEQVYQKLKIHLFIPGIYVADTVVRNTVYRSILFNSKRLDITYAAIGWELVTKLQSLPFHGTPGGCWKELHGPLWRGLQVTSSEKKSQQQKGTYWVGMPLLVCVCL